MITSLEDLLEDLTPELDRALRQGIQLDLGDLGVVRIRELPGRPPGAPVRPEPAPPPGGPATSTRSRPSRVRIRIDEKSVPLRFSAEAPPTSQPAPEPPPPPRRRTAVSLAQLSAVLQAAPEGAALPHLAAWFSLPETALRPMLERLVKQGLLEERPGAVFRLRR